MTTLVEPLEELWSQEPGLGSESVTGRRAARPRSFTSARSGVSQEDASRSALAPAGLSASGAPSASGGDGRHATPPLTWSTRETIG